MDYPPKTPAFTQTDTSQTERQRERHGNVEDGSEQELSKSSETLRQCPDAPGRTALPRNHDPSSEATTPKASAHDDELIIDDDTEARHATWH